MIVTVEAVDGAVYDVRQELVLELVDERLHEVKPNEPPAPPSLQATVPEGDDGDVLVSDTIAVKVI